MLIHISGRTIETDAETTDKSLYDIILSARSSDGSSPKLHSPCGGHLKCGKCTVCAVIREESYADFTAQNTADLSEAEKSRVFDQMHVPEELRSRTIIVLACGLPASPAITDVFLPDPEEIYGADSASVILPGAKFAPVVLSKEITLVKPTVEKPIDTYTNLYDGIFGGDNPITAADFGYNPSEYTVISTVSDEVVDFTTAYLAIPDCPMSLKIAVTCSVGKSKNTLHLTASVVLSIPPCSLQYRTVHPLGLAVDLGTTTIALSLWNLETGAQTASRVITNPQRSFGADVISRMSYAAEHGTEILQKTVHDALRDGVLAMLEAGSSADNSLNDIIYVSLAGNSVMEHLFCGRPTDSIAKAPFYMADRFGYAVTAKDVLSSIFCHQSAPVYLAPLAASYIGGDITIGLAYLVHADPALSSGNSLFLDLGTNGEICACIPGDSLYGLSKPTYLFAATAAGPALEGAHIKMGMSATPGAISKVEFSESDEGEFSIFTIADDAPIGICGSGLIDAIACCLDAGLITEYGRICDDGEPEDEQYESVYAEFESKINEDDDGKLLISLTDSVYLHESDIRQVQTAKAAIAAGSGTLLEAAGISESDLNSVYLAGSFGRGINPQTSARIGLLPDVPSHKVKSVGNTSAKGAAGFLLHSEIRNSLNDILLNSRYIELSGSSQFTELYVENMIFGTLE